MPQLRTLRLTGCVTHAGLRALAPPPCGACRGTGLLVRTVDAPRRLVVLCLVPFVWPFPTGRRRPSVRVGFPWLGGFIVWMVCARLAVDHRWLLRIDAKAWMFWLAVGAVAVPVAVAIVSLLVTVRLSPRGLASSVVAGFAGTSAFLLFRALGLEYAPFAFLGGMADALLVTAAYGVSTSSGLEAWRDGNAR